MSVTLGVEDGLSESIAKRLIAEYAPNVEVLETLGLRGNHQLRQSLRRLNEIATHQRPVLVLTDLDQPQSCPPALLMDWTQGLTISPQLTIRVAVLEVEAWLLADRAGIARWLSVAVSRVPYNPDGIADPKRTLIELANRSRNRDLREAIVPRHGTGTHRTGPGYNQRASEFAMQDWNTEDARTISPSLDRAIIRIGELALRRQP